MKGTIRERASTEPVRVEELMGILLNVPEGCLLQFQIVDPEIFQSLFR
jgi:hypothetical protein